MKYKDIEVEVHKQLGKKVGSAMLECYKIMFKKSTPSANFIKLVDSGITKKRNWFMKYYISADTFAQIIKTTSKKYKLTKREQHILVFNVALGCSPTSVKKTSHGGGCCG